ncbi:MAG: hypothetical protein KME30_32040 [Iphinoe sp. HA4291-MV1]|jgi:hypothetical protein|nr:hypothetical protein [Iphinoe sp. HA4291-MV1]
MAELYQAIPKSDGKLEIQGLQYIFNTGGDIVESPVVGDKYYDPNTGKMASLIGQTEYDNLTITGILSKAQFQKLKTLYDSSKAKDGTLTATHQIGQITTILTGVRLLRLQYGSFDKSSNSPAEVSLEISYSGLRTT